ncbi:CDGSH iron-sulfur domain-containing protein [Defluviicoccus vanus]|uniref:CDGSH iron-sulfur domain-containing protein n=1 Tax=Defluviicoccus vanus TaxID=111831 RepID=A0A7H1N2A2_9PROT|nr:CDGSH iron-sulfur domain-containing protein [Defluviicoccus vanus]QNT69838.1 CDGSH iron-sulfur domain-containing protein [Defluviicoccus vanus]
MLVDVTRQEPPWEPADARCSDRPEITLCRDVEAGRRYAWCSCGRSSNQPFCDGSHQGTGLMPVLFTPERTETVYLCGCKHTQDKPYCDGTHENL